MTIEQVDDKYRRHIAVGLEGDRAYELELVRRDGKDSARCVVAGSQPPARLFLSPGEYTIRLDRLADVPTQPLIERTVIAPDTKRLDLVAIFRERIGEDEYRPIGIPQVGDVTEAIRQSRRFEHPAGTGALAQEVGHLQFGTSAQTHATQPVFKSAVQDARDSEPLRLEIGLSQSLAGSHRGWQPAAGLNIDRELAGDGTLTLVIRDAKSGDRPRRVRLTLAIEGRASIRAPLPLFRDGVGVSFARRPMNVQADGLIRIKAVNGRKQALVAALSSLSGADAMSILDWSADGDGEDAIALLAKKGNDLWAATAAALLLAKIYRLKPVARCAYNLEDLAPHISDAGVAAAWARASDEALDIDQAEAETLAHLVRSRKIGAPTFKVTPSIALELLNAIRGSSQSAERRRQAREETAIWTRRAGRRLLKSPYIMWEQTGRHLTGGKLPGERYVSVAKGHLLAQGFDIVS